MLEHKSKKIWKLLEDHKINPNGLLMVHSAFARFSRIGFDCDDVLTAFLDYMKHGTILFPTMSWRYVNPKTPIFYIDKTPSNTGILTELFRQKYAEKRSLHPTHSVAGRGDLCGEVLSTHHIDSTPCSKLSPFGKLLEFDAQILLFGISIDCCSLIHHGEELYALEHYLVPKDAACSYPCQDEEGSVSKVQVRKHKLLKRDYWQFQDTLASKGLISTKILSCEATIAFKANDLHHEVKSLLSLNPRGIISENKMRYRVM